MSVFHPSCVINITLTIKSIKYILQGGTMDESKRMVFLVEHVLRLVAVNLQVKKEDTCLQLTSNS
jgi:hypothetical protein